MKKLLCDLPKLRIKFFCPHTDTYGIGKNSVFLTVSKFQNDHKSILFFDHKKLPVVVIIIMKAVCKENIVQISAFQYGNHSFQFFSYFQIIAALLPCLIHFSHCFHTHIYDNSFVYRLGKVFQNTQINGFFCIAEFIISRNNNKNSPLIIFLYLLYSLDPIDTRHLNIHKGNIRPEAFCQLHHCSACLCCGNFTFISEI